MLLNAQQIYAYIVSIIRIIRINGSGEVKYGATICEATCGYVFFSSERCDTLTFLFRGVVGLGCV